MKAVESAVGGPSPGLQLRRARVSWPRRSANVVMSGMMVLAALLTLLPLVVILLYLVKRGAAELTPAFFLHTPRPIGVPGSGMANDIIGTLIIIAVASALGVPVGVGAGVYLAEHRSTWLANLVRFLADVLNGLPSIVMGIFAWQLLVRPVGHFSALSGGIALGCMMIPTVTRTTEEMVRIVPNALREAALALGYRRWRASLRIILPAATAGIITGIMVAMARIAGETAPLLFTAFGNQFWSTSLTQPIGAMPLDIYNYAISPYDEWHRLAWAASLVLIGLILIVSIVARWSTRRRFR